jgi:DNA polymerase I-like protein with 3'-5' exonuclease and polymerase domains
MTVWRQFLTASRVEPVLVTDPGLVIDLFRQLRNSPRAVAFDIETCGQDEAGSGLDPLTGRIRLASFYDGGREAWVLDFDALGVRPEALLGELGARRLVAFFAIFEAGFTIEAGLKLVYDDANLALGLRLDRDSFRGLDLGQVAKKLRVLDPPGSADKTAMQTSDFSGPISAEQVCYSAADSLMAWHVWEELAAEREAYARAYALAARAITPTARMMLNGLPFDEAAHHWVSGQWKKLFQHEKLELRRLNTLEPTSAQRMGERLPSILSQEKLARWPRTETGRYSMSAKLLTAKKLVDTHPEVTQFMRANSLRTLTRNFGHDLAKRLHPFTGKLHGRLGLAQARTGRYTSSGPNLQNMPAGPFRRVFAAPPGRVILSADYAAIELRIACLLAGETTLVEVFRHPPKLPDGKRNPLGDPHQQVTDALRLDPSINVKLRLAKALNYSTLYGSSAAGFANAAGITEEEACQHLGGYWTLRSKLAQWQRETNARTLQTRMSKTELGREVTCVLPAKVYKKDPEVVKEHERTSLQRGLNIPIQGAAAELMLLAVCLVDEELQRARIDAHLLLTIHDELVVEAGEAYADLGATILRKGMEQAFAELFSTYDHYTEVARYVVGEIEVGPSWGGPRLDPEALTEEERKQLFKGLLEEVVDYDDDEEEADDEVVESPEATVILSPASAPPLPPPASAAADNLDIPDFLDRRNLQ